MDSIVFLYHQRFWTYDRILDKIVCQGGVDTKSVDKLGHTDIKDVDKLGHTDTKSVDKTGRSKSKHLDRMMLSRILVYT